jgi:hypothetical protein
MSAPRVGRVIVLTVTAVFLLSAAIALAVVCALLLYVRAGVCLTVCLAQAFARTRSGRRASRAAPAGGDLHRTSGAAATAAPPGALRLWAGPRLRSRIAR